MKCLSSLVNVVVVTALFSNYIADNKEFLMKKKTIIFRCVDSAFPQLYCLIFSLNRFIFLSVMQEKGKGCFFGNTVQNSTNQKL